MKGHNSMVAVQSIHSFPARMAPEIALKELQKLPEKSIVLDPMMGSGTVLKVAIASGHHAIGRDIDPLAVLMAKVWTTPINTQKLRESANHLVHNARTLNIKNINLPWIDDDSETSMFIDYWFGNIQKIELRKLSYLIQATNGPEKDALSIALSRIIITKDIGASLGRDISHSRPHRVMTENVFSVMDGFLNEISHIARRLDNHPSVRYADVRQEDARYLASIASASVDAVLTSPPYLNAIDYLRGHKLALVWLGYRISEIRTIRSESVGAERAPDIHTNTHLANTIIDQLALENILPNRELNIIKRYVLDLFVFLSETHRTLRPSGSAIFVIGNSCLRGVFIKNALAIKLLAEQIGFRYLDEEERELPPNRRYLPPPSSAEHNNLKKRMRTETVLKFTRP